MFLNRHRLDYWVRASSSQPFTPTSLFAGGETGGWWNVADHTTTFQDAAGTVAANTAGQVVRRINDKSGNGNNLVNTDLLSSVPILRNSGALWWLECRITGGANQYLQLLFTLNQPTTRVSAAQLVNWANGQSMWDGGAGNHGRLYCDTSSPIMSINAGAVVTNTTDCTPGTNQVQTEIYNGASSSLRFNSLTATTGDAGANNIDGVTIGGAASLAPSNFSDTNWYGAVWIGRVLLAAEQANCRTFFGNLAGLTL